MKVFGSTAEKPKASPLGLGIAVPDTHESPPRRAHRRGASAPLSPSHRAALACEGGRILRDGSRGGPGDFQLPRSYEAGDAGPTFRRTESMPSFAMHWDPTAEWTARSARMLATALIFIALVGWVALPSSRPQAQDAVQATLHEPVRRHSRPPRAAGRRSSLGAAALLPPILTAPRRPVAGVAPPDRAVPQPLGARARLAGELARAWLPAADRERQRVPRRHGAAGAADWAARLPARV